MKLSKEVKVGLLALVAGVVLYVGFNFLKGVDFFSPTQRYYVIYDGVEGLQVSNPVVLNGVSVGRVGSIQLMVYRNNKVLVTLEVDDVIQLNDSSRALLSNTGLLGGAQVELLVGKSTKPLVGDTIKGMSEKTLSEALTEKAMPILSNLDSTVSKLNKMFGDELGTSVKTTLHNFEIASNDLKLAVSENRHNIIKITKNFADLSASIKETEKELKPLLAKFSTLADTLNDMQLKETVSRANVTMKNLQSVSEKIDKAQGSMGMLINDKALYNNLNQSSKDLDALLVDLKAHPKRYVSFSVFGKKDKKSKTDTTSKK